MSSFRDPPASSPDALGRLYERYVQLVYRIAYRMTGSPADAEDVAQDVFLGLPDALRSYEGRGSFEAWIRRVAVRTTLMRMRTARRRREVALDTVAPPPQPDPANAVDARVTLETAVLRLPEALRVVFVLKEVEELPHTEIAALLGISVGTSEVRLHRARGLLRRWLAGSR